MVRLPINYHSILILCGVGGPSSTTYERRHQCGSGNIYTWYRPEHREKESVVNDIGYYAHQVSLDIVDKEVETADGYLLVSSNHVQ